MARKATKIAMYADRPMKMVSSRMCGTMVSAMVKTRLKMTTTAADQPLVGSRK